MIMVQIGEFKSIREGLPLAVRTQIDNLMLSVHDMGQYLCELEPQYQHITINLDTNTVLTFIMAKQPQVKIYAYLTQPGNAITQQAERSS